MKLIDELNTEKCKMLQIDYNLPDILEEKLQKLQNYLVRLIYSSIL